MSGLRRRDNEAELALRRLLHAAGYRYRVTYPVPGRSRRTIDIAFTRHKVAVFIDGCFWHGCPEHGTRPTSNAEWWSTKLAANRARDADTTEHLETHGWLVLRVWEHEEPVAAVQRLRAEVDRQRAPQAANHRTPPSLGEAPEPRPQGPRYLGRPAST